jgi:uncharacterized protein YjbI with pentapeptide repeats
MGRSDELRLLRERWRASDVRDDVARLRTALLRGERAVSPFAEVGGRVDLRGLPVCGMVAGWRDRSPRLQAGSDPSRGLAASRPVAWEGLDLTGAELWEMSWTELAVRDCVLDDADLSGLRCWGVDVARCSMRRVKLFHAQMGAPDKYWPRRSQWRDVDLRQSDLRGAIATVVFQDIDFRNAKFQGTNFGWSDLKDCRFAGVVHGLTLGRRPIPDQPAGWTLSGVDFTAASPRRLDLIGVNLDAAGIRFPSDPNHWLIPDWPDFAHRLGAVIPGLPEGRLKLTASIWLEHRAKDQGPGQTGFVAAWDLEQLGGPELRKLVHEARLDPESSA